ncbi:hypothetical protein GCM10009077_33520 [Roseibium denhamense]|uniref:Uncharacterized protein n=1 Tax=Roseibium denhamense TaxID=76305 RepID=A0ABY1NXI6_9HYPH|nr:hypothetical protein SAMN06265374_2115 [Roseibium denhamense]
MKDFPPGSTAARHPIRAPERTARTGPQGSPAQKTNAAHVHASKAGQKPNRIDSQRGKARHAALYVGKQLQGRSAWQAVRATLAVAMPPRGKKPPFRSVLEIF